MGILQQIQQAAIDGRMRREDQWEQRDLQKKLAAWRPILGKLGAETAAEIGPLVTSNDPAAVQSGQSLLSGLLQQADPQYRQQLDNAKLQAQSQRQQNLIAASQEKRASELFPLQVQNERLQQQGYLNQQKLFPLQLEAARAQAQQAAAQITASTLSAEAKQAMFINTVRGQYQALPAVKTAVEAQGAYKAATAAANTGSALGAELALVKMAKLADPTSVVREGETERIREGYGLVSQVSSILRKAGSKGMTPEQRAMYLDVLDALYGPAMEQAALATRQYMGLEAQYKARPGEIVNSVGLDWTLVPGGWKEQSNGQPAKVKSWGGR